MPTKICIIEVDLGASIDDIIAEDVEALTGSARAELDQAIEVAKAAQRVKLERDQASKAAADKLSTAMAQAYEALVGAGEVGLPVSNIMAIVAGAVPNSSAFTIRMKHILAEKGNPYVLDRKKVHGTPHYIFVPYNQQPAPPQ